MSLPPPLPSHSTDDQLRSAKEDVRRGKTRRRWLLFFLIVSIIFNLIFFGVFSLRFTSPPVKKESRSVFVERYLSGDHFSDNKIAVIRLEGVISGSVEGHVGYDGMVGDIKEQIRLAQEDEDVKAILVRIDSPGGEVLASDEIYRALKEARAIKPIICSMGSLAASGGYYAAMGCDWVVADELTITGSIGVIMQTLNYKDLFGKIGLRSLVFKSGKFKDILNGGREPTEEEMSLIQNLVMETYEKFLGIVAKERHLDSEELRNNFADGRILSGKQALAVKLVDQNGSFQDAIKKAMEKAKITDARVSDYVVPFNLRNFLGIFAESSQKPKIQIDLSTGQIPLQNGKLYYLSSHLFN